MSAALPDRHAHPVRWPSADPTAVREHLDHLGKVTKVINITNMITHLSQERPHAPGPASALLRGHVVDRMVGRAAPASATAFQNT